MQYVLIIIIFLLLICLFSFLSNSGKENDSKHDNFTNTVKYVKKEFYLSTSEYNFYTKLVSLENELHVHIVPQVSLNSIIDKAYNNKNRNDLNYIVDFGIFDSTLKNVLLLIELNDSSHNRYDRKRRDKRVYRKCKEAGVKLITFYTDKPNEVEYMHNRIRNELNKRNTPPL